MDQIDDRREQFDRIDHDRRDLLVSWAELCRRAEISESTVSKIKRAQDRVPHMATLRKLRAALETFGGKAA